MDKTTKGYFPAMKLDSWDKKYFPIREYYWIKLKYSDHIEILEKRGEDFFECGSDLKYIEKDIDFIFKKVKFMRN